MCVCVCVCVCVFRYSADTGEYVVHTGKSVNAAAAARGLAPARLTDTTLATTVIGKSAHALADAGDAHLTGDIAGVFVVDEFIGAAAVAAVVAAIEEGEDSDGAFRAFRDREREVLFFCLFFSPWRLERTLLWPFALTVFN